MKNWQRRLLGFFPIAGGAIGSMTFLLFLTQSPQFTFTNVLTLVVGQLFFGWSIWCGILMLEGAPSALRFNRILWALQIPFFQLPFFSYFAFSGMRLLVTVNPNSFEMGLQWNILGAQIAYLIGTIERPNFIGLNVIAIAIVYFLSLQLQKVEESA